MKRPEKPTGNQYHEWKKSQSAPRSSHCYTGRLRVYKHMRGIDLPGIVDISENETGDLHEPTLTAWVHHVLGIKNYTRDRFPKVKIEITVLENDAD